MEVLLKLGLGRRTYIYREEWDGEKEPLAFQVGKRAWAKAWEVRKPVGCLANSRMLGCVSHWQWLLGPRSRLCHLQAGCPQMSWPFWPQFPHLSSGALSRGPCVSQIKWENVLRERGSLAHSSCSVNINFVSLSLERQKYAVELYIQIVCGFGLLRANFSSAKAWEIHRKADCAFKINATELSWKTNKTDLLFLQRRNIEKTIKQSSFVLFINNNAFHYY